MSHNRVHPRPINHVAVSVRDITAVVDWYSQHMGFQLIGTITHLKRSATPTAAIFQIYLANLNEVKIAYMTTGNGVGFEVFQFVDPAPVASDSFEYNRCGFFHICVTDANPTKLAQTVIQAGGRQIGIMTNIAGNECLYLADPWGNVVEVLSTSFERLASQVAV
ncbi:hypothetical protein FE257_009517 [Aspergillus nanangensis]|uniref:VOC domain-containing protein n=1 Tax=Aspergillus nanangensis TaxID=2582783 RepID=A0AAD4CKA9_ASPNN|nr:hypothetical protein FE257_009517 [Aspergillus nanangensis]